MGVGADGKTQTSQSSISAAFEDQVGIRPNAVAAQAGVRHLTYEQLDQAANRLAHRLHTLGVEPGDIVGVIAERGLETIVALVGILKAGAAYSPLDPESPRLRLRDLLNALQARVAIAPPHLADLACDSDRVVETPNLDLDVLLREPSERIDIDVKPDDLCAVLFTSGTTGRPKGVALEHRNLLNLLHSAPELAPRPEETALQVCAPQFDMAAYEIWATLLNGGRLVCHPPGRPDPRAVCHTVVANKVSWAQMATSTFHQLVEHGPERLSGLRMLLVGGETMLPHYARRFRTDCPETRLFNIYGPAETTVFACVHEIRSESLDKEAIPIGRSIAGAQLLILDDNRQPVQDGERGELFIGGPGVSRGYLHQPELTAERYTPNPFAPGEGERLYRSGDLVRKHVDGTLEIFGRIDYQIKLNGYRVEPGEVEAHLATHPSVSQATAIGRKDVPGHQQLVAYVVFAHGESEQSRSEVRHFLEERLPSYMIPSAIVALDSLPRTLNEKVDRAALPAPRSVHAADKAEASPSGSVTSVITEMFAKVLAIRRVDETEDFFELGGNSLLAVQLLARLRSRLGIELPLSAVFEARTATQLAKVVEISSPAPRMVLPALLPRAHRASAPATAGQMKALAIGEMADESLPYQSQAMHRIVGCLDLDALEWTLSEIVRRHESLRTTFKRVDGRWFQHVREPTRIRLVVEDLSSATNVENALQEHFGEVCRIRLDPGRLPLARWSLAKLAEDHHALIFLEHHVVHDGVSTARMLQEIATLYRAAVMHEESLLPEPAVQYRDFAVWQEELVESEYGRRTLAYWHERLLDAPRQLVLPFDRPRPPRQTYRGNTLRLQLPDTLATDLARRGREWGATTFIVTLAAYCTLLARYCASEELVVGSGLANRRTLASEDLIGMVVNTVPLRIDLRNEPTIREFVDRVRKIVLEAHTHQDVPFEKVVEHLAPARVANAAPLYQALFSFHDAPVQTMDVPGAVIVPQDALPNGSAKADLSVVVIDRCRKHPGPIPSASYESLAEDGLTLTWEYNSDLFEPNTAERMLGHYRELLEQIVSEDEEQPLSSLTLGRDADRERVLAFSGRTSQYERETTIAEVFRMRAAETPSATALSMQGHTLTYSQLERRTNRLGHHLRSLGAIPGVRVGVCMERSLEMIVALLAVTKTGAAYVPLDPLEPTGRLQSHVDTLGIPLILSLGRHRDQVPDATAELIFLDDSLGLDDERDSPIPPRAQALDPAYVMFTSGSSGEPKGVEVPHRAVLRLARSADYVQLGPQETILGFAPFTFDASTFEIWGALLNGARLALAPPGPLTSGELGELLILEDITTMWLTASLFNRIVDDRPEMLCSVKQLLAGGDVLSPDHVRRALRTLPKDAVLINGYGPTEATTFTCAHQMTPDDAIESPIPIGRSIPNSHVYILDAEKEPVPIGVPGELYIGGDGVAIGYVNAPQLTAERFLADPFRQSPQARMYRSGDLARWRPDGTIDFLGRSDRQLKIRGFRIEPGEVENALRSYPGVADTFVMSVEHTTGDLVLAAHIAKRSGSVLAVEDLRAHVARALPSHAVPSVWNILERLPLTASGKVDINNLPRPSGNSRGSEDTQKNARGPSPDSLERRLLAIWERALGIHDIERDDDFFDLGGHSLLAVEVFDAIERSLGVRISLASIFEAPTVRLLARHLREDGWKSPHGSLVALNTQGSKPPLFLMTAGDGNSVGFGALARNLGPDQPCFALQPRGVDGGAPLHRSVERMAGHYLRAIQRVQPRGPYLLGGRCLGCLVAYEVARRLRARGQQVALLLMLDSGGPLLHTRRLADGTPFDQIMNSAIHRVDPDVAPRDIFTTAGTKRLMQWLAEPVITSSDGTPINRYLHEVYRVRSDVRDAFPDLSDRDTQGFVEWAWMSGRDEHGLTERLLPVPLNARSKPSAGVVGLATVGLRNGLSAARTWVSWHASEAADLLTGERRQDAAARRRERLRQASRHAWDTYRAGDYSGIITLVRSEEPHTVTLLEQWHALDTAGVIERRVRGTHRSILREPDVAGLADCIGELVETHARSQQGLHTPIP